jgi:hypothetical protein
MKPLYAGRHADATTATSGLVTTMEERRLIIADRRRSATQERSQRGGREKRHPQSTDSSFVRLPEARCHHQDVHVVIRDTAGATRRKRQE